MYVRLFRKGQENLLGTINTSGVTAEATGVGEPLLDAWVRANKDAPSPDVTRQLETFFAAWNRPETYSQVESPARITEEVEDNE